MQKTLWWVGFVWCLPVTLAGALFALLTGSVRPIERFEGAVFLRSSGLLDALFFRGRWVSFTWGAVCIVARGRDLSLESKLHEVEHFRQARIYGPLLPLAYADGAVSAVSQGGHWYRDNPLEAWARRVAAVRFQERAHEP